jgi:hypothetical protein
MPEKPKTALRDNALRLDIHCPVDRSNPADCPLFAIRKLGPAKRVQWFHDLTGDDLIYLNAYHSICFRIKMESTCGENPRLSVSVRD